MHMYDSGIDTALEVVPWDPPPLPKDMIIAMFVVDSDDVVS